MHRAEFLSSKKIQDKAKQKICEVRGSAKIGTSLEVSQRCFATTETTVVNFQIFPPCFSEKKGVLEDYREWIHYGTCTADVRVQEFPGTNRVQANTTLSTWLSAVFLAPTSQCMNLQIRRWEGEGELMCACAEKKKSQGTSWFYEPRTLGWDTD